MRHYDAAFVVTSAYQLDTTPDAFLDWLGQQLSSRLFTVNNGVYFPPETKESRKYYCPILSWMIDLGYCGIVSYDYYLFHSVESTIQVKEAHFMLRCPLWASVIQRYWMYKCITRDRDACMVTASEALLWAKQILGTLSDSEREAA